MWLAILQSQAELLDGIDVAMCAYDLQERPVLSNRSFLRLFPGQVVPSEAAEFAHGGLRLQASSTPVPGFGRIAVWRTVGAAPDGDLAAALQLTLDNAGRGIIRYDAEGRILLFNRQALQLLDLPEPMFGQSLKITDVVRFQQERGDFSPEALQGLAPYLTPPSGPYDHFRDQTYLRRTRAGRVLEIATRTLPDGGAVRTYTDITENYEAQLALSEKSEALQITLDSMSQGITAIDGNGTLAFWNRRYQELLELPDEVLQGKPKLDEIVRFQTARGDFGPNFEYVDAVARGYVQVGDRLGPQKGPESYVRKTRDGRSFDVTTRPLPDGGVVRTFTDITAHARTQEALAYKQAQLEALVNNLPDRVWLRDLDGRFLLSNPAHHRYHGLAAGDMVGRSALEVFGPERAGRQAVTDARAFASQEPISFEFRDVTPDGSERFAEVVKVAMRDEDGRAIGLLGIARDITVRKQAEAALIQAKEEALLASTAKSRFLSSMSHEIRTPMNAVLGMLTLLRATELTPHQDDYAGKAEGAARALLSLLNDILDFSKIEAGKMRLDTRAFSLEGMLSELSVILSSNVGGKQLEVLYDLDPRVPDGLVGDDMRLRQILINLGGNAVKFTERGEVVVCTRLVALEEGHASIEFSVRDSGIGISEEQQQRLFGDFVQATDDTARQFGGTGLGLGICRRLTELMASSLQLESKLGEGSRFWFTVRLPVAAAPAQTVPPAVESAEHPRVLIVDDNPVARDTLAALARAAGWDADTAAGGRQALANITAAAVAGQPYDTVFIDWVMPGMDGWQTCSRIRALPLSPRMPLVVMVTAHGREMLDSRPAGEKALLDGFLVKPVTIGMLRAALVRGRHEGGAPARITPAATPQPLAGLRLLLAEDNPVNQQIAIELLARRGAQVEVAENGRIAVDKALAERYDAVLMDVQMPVMNGMEATRELRHSFDARALPIIAMTANAMDTDRQDCFAAGMNAHVAKPFMIEEVVATILGCLGRAAPTGAAALPIAAAEPPVLDRAAALDRLGGDEELLRHVLVSFRANLADADRALAGEAALPAPELARLLHSIKGMAGNLAAIPLAQVAESAESRLRSGAAAPTGELLAEVRGAVGRVLRELEPPLY